MGGALREASGQVTGRSQIARVSRSVRRLTTGGTSRACIAGTLWVRVGPHEVPAPTAIVIWGHPALPAGQRGREDPQGAKNTTYPRCSGGGRACPPEDSGGPEGYEDTCGPCATARAGNTRWPSTSSAPPGGTRPNGIAPRSTPTWASSPSCGPSALPPRPSSRPRRRRKRRRRRGEREGGGHRARRRPTETASRAARLRERLADDAAAARQLAD
ncbi:hypothetical protein AB0B45_48395 [Nonomuraea sp. NPDC049152]|uniref:IS1096 element passenger TnpR family protein n=1 Tax=Nonomuraea sp. NPDC049152 TaxID=3154350 RepID=UPI0033C81F96